MGELIEHNGVKIDGTLNFPASIQIHASQLYAKNISTFLTYMVKDGHLNLNLDDEIISGAMFTHNGKVTHELTSKALGEQ